MSCLWSGYSVWSDCSGSCGTGVRRRTRRVLQEALNGGSDCVGGEEETEDCPLPDCPPPPCQSTEWSAWSSCSSSCGPGARSRSRRGDPTNTAGTVECREESEEEECLDRICPGKTYSGWAPVTCQDTKLSELTRNKNSSPSVLCNSSQKIAGAQPFLCLQPPTVIIFTLL